MNREEALQKLEALRQQFTELRENATAARIEPVKSRIRSLCRSTTTADAIIDSPELAFKALLSEDEDVRLSAMLALDFLWKMEPPQSRSHLVHVLDHEESPRVMKLLLSIILRRFCADQDGEFIAIIRQRLANPNLQASLRVLLENAVNHGKPCDS
jgi:hypothetical protein